MAKAFICSLATICFLFQLQSSFLCEDTVFDMNLHCAQLGGVTVVSSGSGIDNISYNIIYGSGNVSECGGPGFESVDMARFKMKRLLFF